MNALRRFAVSFGSLVLPVMGFAQAQQQVASTLSVNGHAGQAPVIQSNGHSFVDVEALARITNGTLGFQANRIVLTLPGTGAAVQPSAPATPAPPPPEPEKGYTRDFLRAGIEGMSVIREWRAAIENAVRTNNPVDESWVSGFRRNAESRMQLAAAAATTDADRQAVPLLQNELSMMRQVSDRLLDMRRSVTFVPTDLLDNDPTDQKILSCAQGLAAQAVPGGQFEDVAACH
jgi:hypothetical protein